MANGVEFPFDDEWQSLITDAQQHRNWFDDHLLPLAEAAFGSSLRRFFPYTAVNNLCFAKGSTYPFPGDQPGWIQFYEGVYVVRRHDLAQPDGISVLETDDPAAAAAALERLLEDEEAG